MSGSSSYRTFESEDESSSWLLSSEGSIDDEDEVSDELTLLNGDEDSNEDTTTFEAFIKLSMRLKEQYNLREASVALERCDKIWDTMQVLKNAQTNYDGEDEAEDDETYDENTDDEEDEDNEDEDEEEEEEEEEEEDCRKSTSDSITSGPTSKAVSYIKYQPTQGNGNNALPNFYLSVKSQRKVYHCATCGKLYNEKRAFRSHNRRDHGIDLPSSPHGRKRLSSSETRVTRSKTPQNVDVNSCDVYKDGVSRKLPKYTTTGNFVNKKNPLDTTPYICPMCANTFGWKASLKKHAMDFHNLDLTDYLRKNVKSEGSREKSKEAPDRKSDLVKDALKGKNIYYRCRRKPDKTGNFFICIPCGHECGTKRVLRTHARRHHDIEIPYCDRRGNIITKDEKRTSGSEELAIREDNSLKKASGLTRKTRAGPKSSKITARPRRACTINTSYTECTREEEEALQREILSMEKQRSTSHTTKCFLCQSSYVDIKRHLKDYHRISSPDSVLPLSEKINKVEAAQAEEMPDKPPVTRSRESPKKLKSESGSSRSESGSLKSESGSLRSERDTSKSDERDDSRREKVTSSGEEGESQTELKIFRSLSRRVINEINGRVDVQCTMCLYKYASWDCLKRHLRNKMVNGVVQDHGASFQEAKPRRRSGKQKSNIKDVRPNEGNDTHEPVTDPLALTNFSDPSRTDDNTSEDTDNSSRKRSTSFSDETSSTSESISSKRRKIELSEITENTRELLPDIANVSTRKNAERESVIRLSENHYRSNIDDDYFVDEDEDDESKTTDQRDTRDSSDRDSGIGISITIKKRNNSYEVVDKDNYCEDDKNKDFEITMDDNVVSSDSSSDITSSDCTNNDGQRLVIPRRREIFRKLNYSSEEGNIATITSNVDDNDVAIIDDRDIVVVTRNNKIDNAFGWKDVSYREEACANMPGKVPSLKVLCRNVLKRNEFYRNMENDKNSHQCPVCCRFYPTERDVTVHMLEHKVSRTTFRCARLHGIPSSALRRYGRRKTSE